MNVEQGKRLLIGCFGCLDAINLHTYLEELRNIGYEVTLWISREAIQFVRPAVLRICASTVVVDDGPDTWVDTRPSSLTQGKDMMVFLPCSANTLGHAASGLASNRFLTCLLSFSGPTIFFPSMGTLMWENPAVKQNVHTLRKLGHTVYEPPLSPSLSGGKHRGLPSPSRVCTVISEVFDE